MIQSLIKERKKTEQQRDVAREHRDRAMNNFRSCMVLVDALNRQLNTVTRERNNAICERANVERMLYQSQRDIEVLSYRHRRTVSERDHSDRLLENVQRERNRAWDTVARLRVELQNSRVEGSLEPAVQRAPPSYPIVEQRRAAEEAEKKYKKSEKTKTGIAKTNPVKDKDSIDRDSTF